MSFVCEYCGEDFKPKSPRADRVPRFCSKECYFTHKSSKATLIKNFWDRVRKTDSCWIWEGFSLPGRGAILGPAVERPGRSATRFSYSLAHGEIPPNKKIVHKCGNQLCVNPEHLKLGEDR